ncbi:hypothetical protein [Planktotalea sp.]|uniref:hypothetical protein n=1 Tax=Planktotalea sp. TaxID=2029877 RepID=UPI0032970AA9
MSKNPKKQVTKKQKQQASAEALAKKEHELKRERTSRMTRRFAIAAPVVLVAGYFTTTSVQAIMSEADLTKINGGKPSIVQIHDPQCPLCRTLQKQARKAMKTLEGGSFEYLVANIRSEDGLAFSSKYGVGHVTLLLFDAEGEMVEIVRGPSDVETLTQVFKAHMRKHG